jgi:DNA-binding HxlR family transcriptional regulator
MKVREQNENGAALSYQADPIRASLDILGRKWTFLILRDIAFLKIERFGQIRRNNPGLTARVLSRRLSEMTKEGLLVREEDGETRYRLTTKGEDAVYILLALLRYGIKHHMARKGKFNEDEILKDLRYETPFGPR